MVSCIATTADVPSPTSRVASGPAVDRSVSALGSVKGNDSPSAVSYVPGRTLSTLSTPAICAKAKVIVCHGFSLLAAVAGRVAALDGIDVEVVGPRRSGQRQEQGDDS